MRGAGCFSLNPFNHKNLFLLLNKFDFIKITDKTICNILSVNFFLFIFLLLFVANCYGQEHHNDNPIDLVNSEDSELTMVVVAFKQHIG
jgi:hypothetical protein